MFSLDEEREHFRRDTERQALFQLEKAKTKPGKYYYYYHCYQYCHYFFVFIIIIFYYNHHFLFVYIVKQKEKSMRKTILFGYLFEIQACFFLNSFLVKGIISDNF